MKKIGIYLHIPFCKTICTYCNFLVFANKTAWIEKYIKALIQEISIKHSKFTDYTVDSIYFGGGTPSLISPELISQVVTALKTHFKIAINTEITIECNPESIDEKRLQIYQKSGINRISLGVQSLNNQTLKKVARPHNSEKTLSALELLNRFGWKNFGCDIIMGLPYQTLTEFTQQLKTILSYQPTHLSSYFLSYDTPRIDTFIKDSPTEDLQIEMYWHLTRELKKQGFKHYEVSNYALPGYQSKHNQKYWQQEEYLGIGIGAHSYINKEVTENTRNFDSYLSNPLEKGEFYPLDKDTERMDFIMLSLRQAKGINLNKYRMRFGNQKTSEILKQAANYSVEYLKISDTKIAATEKGFLILDKITRDLL